MAKPYLNQDFEKIKKDCFKRRELFTDAEFRADAYSIAKFNHPRTRIVWKRPHQIIHNPQFYVDDADPKDFNQAAAIAISQFDDFKKAVLPEGQSFKEGEYCGAFHFRFWRFGEWLDVVVDDYLAVDQYTNQLVYCKNTKAPNEFWCALLEKAYAKLNSCYEFLNGGLTADALIDLTGGVEENFEVGNLQKYDYDRFWKLIKKAYRYQSLIGCNIFSNSMRGEAKLANGLIANHAYAVTKIYEIKNNSSHYDQFNYFHGYRGGASSSSNIRLVRIRNPWGNHDEWNGAFSDFSREWDTISEKDKKEMGLVRDYDGEFWMPFEAFMKNFHHIHFVHVNMNLFSSYRHDSNSNTYKWSCKTHHGKLNQYGSENPQYVISIRDVDPDDDDNKATMIISMIQKDSVANRDRHGGQIFDNPIRVSVYRINKTNPQYTLVNSSHFTQARSISKRYKLDPGDYLLIPEASIQSGINELSFVLRIFTESELGKEDLSYLNREKLVTSFQRKQEQRKNKNLVSKSNSSEKNPPGFGFIFKKYQDEYNMNSGDEDDDYKKFESAFDDSAPDADGKNDETIVQFDTDCNSSSTQEKCSIM